MITIEKWSGLVTAASPYALPGGAAVHQVNLQCVNPGQLQCRSGCATVVSTAYPVVSMVRFSTGTQDTVFALVGGSFAIITP